MENFIYISQRFYLLVMTVENIWDRQVSSIIMNITGEEIKSKIKKLDNPRLTIS